MSIDKDNKDFNISDVFANAATPVAFGALPTAIVGMAKAPIPLVVKIPAMTAMAIGAFIFGGLREIPHEHPPEFCHPETGKPLEKGDVIIHAGEEKTVVGYTGHHHSVFTANTVREDANGHEVHMRDKPLWTGPFKLVASSYGGGENKKTGLVLSRTDSFHDLHKHDISGNGPFQSADASEALAISPKGQKIHEVTIHNPKTLGVEHKPGFFGQMERITNIFKSKGILEGVKTSIDPKTAQILHDMSKHIKNDRHG